MDRISRLITVIFGAVGVAMLALAGFLLVSELSFRREAVQTTGTVVDLEYSGKTARPVFEYRDAGGTTHRATGRVGSKPPAFDRGETVTVLYRAEDPSKARIAAFAESWLAATILGGFGAVFSAVGGGFLAHMIRKRRMRAWLETNGMRVQARYTGAELDRSLRVNGRHPWRIHAEWEHPVTQELHEFISDAIFFDPTRHIDRETLDVKVDANDPRRYHLDISFLPRIT